MEKIWFATNELLGVAGLPRTRQGLNRKAREHGWERRRRKGGRGKAVEYAIWSLPEAVRELLIGRHVAGCQRISLRTRPALYELSAQEYTLRDNRVQEDTWLQLYHELSAEERTLLIGHILREGARGVLARLDDRPGQNG
ncbi:DNA-binding protein [Dickeya lacustris]|uniref:DNA-binding protein n=1 Tax=Dickeya lacustris TaxID=2259638 RepID=A0ABY8GCE5_9GAMM|nr:DNA-binding protein [Dickeya lacustris]WFN57596.1 DNA-binding protein [Dickeya lacustris]